MKGGPLETMHCEDCKQPQHVSSQLDTSWHLQNNPLRKGPGPGFLVRFSTMSRPHQAQLKPVSVKSTAKGELTSAYALLTVELVGW